MKNSRRKLALLRPQTPFLSIPPIARELNYPLLWKKGAGVSVRAWASFKWACVLIYASFPTHCFFVFLPTRTLSPYCAVVAAAGSAKTKKPWGNKLNYENGVLLCFNHVYTFLSRSWHHRCLPDLRFCNNCGVFRPVSLNTPLLPSSNFLEYSPLIAEALLKSLYE